MNGGDAVLLTGATGFVGMELLARYLERTQRRVFVLVRAESREHAMDRTHATLEAALGSASHHAERVTALAGDITEPGLGLRTDDAEAVARDVGEIVHGAASVSFDVGLAESRDVNVEGTRRVLDFADLCQSHGGLRRFSYVSTAYVAGEHTGVFDEDDLDVGQRFRNPYEQSKYEAERLVAERRSRLPITVVRPSIIVGDSHTGWTASFNVLYWPLRALARESYPALPARRSAPVDVVSVDYVADAIFALAQAPEAEGHTFHLTASGDASSIGELLGLAVAGLECASPPVIPPRVYRHLVLPVLVRMRPEAKSFLEATEAYLPYFAMKVTYDDARSRAALPSDIAPAHLASYFSRLLGFALLTDWGRRPLSRAQAKDAQANLPAP